MSKSLIKLLDNALFPAAFMVFGKFIGIFFTIKIFQLPWSVEEYANNFFSVSPVFRPEDINIVTSYSDMVMYIFLAIGLSVVLARAIYFHNSHIRPTLISRLANNNLLHLVQGSYEIYHSAVAWLIFLWISNIVLVSNVVNGRGLPWIAVFATLCSVILTATLLQDVYREIENIKNKPGDYNWQ